MKRVVRDLRGTRDLFDLPIGFFHAPARQRAPQRNEADVGAVFAKRGKIRDRPRLVLKRRRRYAAGLKLCKDEFAVTLPRLDRLDRRVGRLFARLDGVARIGRDDRPIVERDNDALAQARALGLLAREEALASSS